MICVSAVFEHIAQMGPAGQEENPYAQKNRK
jgi:hypothetical protein